MNTDATPANVGWNDGLGPSWDAMRVPCKGPCWDGFWLVFQKRGNDVGPYYLNDAGNPKRFRSEAAARRALARLNK